MGWFKNQMMALALSLSRVEQNTLSQISENSAAGVDMTQKKTQGTIWDALINGELTEEVKLFRARLYKVTEALNKVVVTLKGYDEDGLPIYDLAPKDDKTKLENYRVSGNEEYKTELVLHNVPITKEFHKTSTSNINETAQYPLVVLREFLPRFLLEKYTDKVIVKNVTDQLKIVDFYVIKYPREFDTNSQYFLTHFEKVKDNSKDDLFVFKSVEFLSGLNDIGVDEGFIIEFENLKYKGVEEFDEFYVVSFDAKLVNFEDTKEFFIDENLDKLYEQKAPRKKLK